MDRPYLSQNGAKRQIQHAFLGYHRNLAASEAELYDERNMSADFYPVLSPRARRGILRTFQKPHVLYTKDKLVWVDGTALYYNGAYVGEVSDTDKQLCRIGALLVIFPDKMALNTQTMALTSLEAEFTTTADVSFTLCRADGEGYDQYETGITAPDTPAAGSLWLDTSGETAVLKQYSETYEAWIAVPATYVKIASENIGKAFAEGDAVTVSGCTDAQFNTDLIITARADGYIVTAGVLAAPFNQPVSEGAVTVSRKVPDMDFVTENDNRIWGCSSSAHEIYCCKLGDPTNWRCYASLASDSYAATVGSDGDFTGAAAYMGNVLFFKEDVIHKVCGTKPANYQITSLYCRGVQKGSERSLALVGETLCYKSESGVFAFDGSLPRRISAPIGKERYTSASAGALGDKYYISMQGEDGGFTLFSYDSETTLWHKEDAVQAKWFARQGGELYFIDGQNRLCSVRGTTAQNAAEDADAVLEEDVSWMAETGDAYMDDPDNGYLAKLQIRMTVPEGGTVKVEFMADDTGVWEEVGYISHQKKRAASVFFSPRRCDHFRLRLSGTGDVKIYSVTKTMYEGSELDGRY